MRTFHFNYGDARVFVSLLYIKLVFGPENIFIAANFNVKSIVNSSHTFLRAIISE